MPYKYYDLDWAKLFQRRCKSKFKDPHTKGRCELKRNHHGAHAKEQGMYWFRWDTTGFVWLTTPGSAYQRMSKGGGYSRNELQEN